MKSFVAFFALVALAAADVSHLARSNDESVATIVSQNADVLPDQASFKYETSNGIAGQADGVLKNPGKDDEAFVFSGSNSYTAPDGQVIQISYVADEYGYQPQGSHLPTPPPPQPIPDYIQRSLDYIAAHPPPPSRN